MLGLAIFAAVVGLIPIASYWLILAELYVLWHAAHESHDYQFGPFFQMCMGLIIISAVLKTITHTAHVVPGVGQVINAAVAFFFILALNQIAQAWYL